MVALVYLTLRLRGATQFSFGGISFLLTYPVAVAFGVAAICAILARGRLQVPRPTLFVYVVAAMFTLWIAVRGFSGPLPTKSFTLVGIQGMGMMLLLGLTTLVRDRKTLTLSTRYVYYVGALLSVAGLILYAGVLIPWLPIGRILGNEADNWAVIFMETNSFIYRYTGFVGDPNFYPFYAVVALCCGLVSVDYRRPRHLVTLGLIQVTILLSMSRTAYVSLLVSAVVVGVLAVAERDETRSDLLDPARIGGVVVVGVGVLGAVVARYPQTARAWVERRLFAALFDDKRFTKTWPHLLDGIVQRPLFGHGARSVEALLGQTAHSAFFGLLYDYGVVGLVLWFALFWYATRVALGSFLDGETLALPWIIGLIVSFGMNLMNSFQYDLMLWLLLGIAVSPALVANGDNTPKGGTDQSVGRCGVDASPAD